MNFPSGGDGNTPSPRKEVQLQGPRPAALKVNKESHKIRKPPIPPQHHKDKDPQPQSQDDEQQQQRQPVIIYAVSPKVIHTTVTDFMNLVQRLTGNTGGGGGDLSPAARLASIETSATTPSPSKDKRAESSDNNNISNMTMMSDLLQDVEYGGRGSGGILSPAPGSLPPISPGFFSPEIGYNYNNNMFLPSSPSTLFSAPLVSPSPSSSYSSNFNLFNPFFDF